MLIANIPISSWQRSRFDAPLVQPNTLTTQLNTSLEVRVLELHVFTEILVEGANDLPMKRTTDWPLMSAQTSKQSTAVEQSEQVKDRPVAFAEMVDQSKTVV